MRRPFTVVLGLGALAVVAVPAVLLAAPPGRRNPPAPEPAPTLPPPAVDPGPLRAAERALAEGLPSAAVPRLQQFLGSDPPPAERRAATLLLARARLETGNPRGALDVLPPGGNDAPDAAFLRAGANAALGQWAGALADYERAGDGPAARFGRAECLRALGRAAEADALLAGLTADPAFGTAAVTRRAELALEAKRPGDAETTLRDSPAALASATGRYLLGVAQLDAGRVGKAEETLAALAAAGPSGFMETLLARTQLALARARAADGRAAEAAGGLERFVDRFPRQAGLPEIFGALEEFRLADNAAAPAGDLALGRWQKDATEPWRGGFAAVTLARIRRSTGRAAEAATLLEEFPTRYPDHPWSARAGAERAALLLARNRPAEARTILAGARALPGGDAADLRVTLDGLDARASVALGDYPAAAARLAALSEAPGLTPARAESALTAAALVRLRARDEDGFRAGRETLARRFPDGRWQQSLPLEEGLLRAAGGDGGGAAVILRGFLARALAPEPRRLAQARLALAEIALENGDPGEARSELRFVANVEPPGETGARAELLSILAADAPGPGRDEEMVITRARTFLARRTTSPLAAEVRLKLGEIYYRREDYPNAETELELVPATATPAVYEAARYLAGLSALGAQSPAGATRAVELFEDVAKLNGPLKSTARLRQAETLRDRLGKPGDAVVLYDAILAVTDPPPDAATRCSALCGKAEATLRMAPGDRERSAEAARWLAAAARVPEAPLFWRRQALARRGAALERAGDPEQAVAAYNDALDAMPTGSDEGDDLTWFYRAGFSAARLLRAHGQWAQAIAIYDKLTRADGPLRAEVESQARALRLEHFIWDDNDQ